MRALLIIGIIWCGLVAHGQCLLSELVRDTKHWRGSSGAVFTRTDDTATVRFKDAGWSAAICQLPIPLDYAGSVEIKTTLQWKAKSKSQTALRLIYLDGGKHGVKVEDPTANQLPLAFSTEEQQLTLVSKVPKEARFIRVDLSTIGGGELEIKAFTLKLLADDPTDLAIRGVQLPPFDLPASKATASATDSAQIQIFNQVPNWDDTAFWAALPTYKVPVRSSTDNCTPDDHQVTFQLAADTDFMYIYCRAKDDQLSFSADRNYQRDCFEFFFMPSGDYQVQGIRQEQYYVTRNQDGSTYTNARGSVTRLIPGGWEAIIRAPLQKDDYRITPFSGLKLKFNLTYQDADTKPQEHYLSFSEADKGGESWRNPKVYVPLQFVSTQVRSYAPIWFGNQERYDVSPKFPGRFNLVKMPTNLDEVGFWELDPVAKLTFNDGVCSIAYPGYATRNVRLLSNALTLFPGEKLHLEMECRIPSGRCREALTFGFLAHNNWAMFGFKGDPGMPIRPGKEWTKMSYTGVVPQTIQSNTRSGRLLMRFGDHPGAVLEFRNLKLTRWMPHDLDMVIKVPALYSHYRHGEANLLQLDVDSPKARKLNLKIQATSVFDGKCTILKEATVAIKAGQTRLQYDLQKELPAAGFYNIAAFLLDGETPLVRRELYVAKYIPPQTQEESCGLWFHNMSSLTPPRDIRGMGEELKRLGYSELFPGRPQIHNFMGELNHYDTLERIKILKSQGFRIGAIINRGTPKTGKEAHELDQLIRETVEKARGVMDYWHFCNEPNLSWTPVADGGEWGVFHRPFATLVRSADPNTTVICGATNYFAMDFLADAITQGAGRLVDGIFAVHLYEVDPNSDGYEKLLANRKALSKLMPHQRVWDTESGMVYYTFPRVTGLYTKKLIIHRCGGIEKTLFYNDRDVLNPHADATPLAAVAPAVATFLKDAAPLGRDAFLQGGLHGYFFRRADGKIAAALWRVVPDKLRFRLPWKDAIVKDQFGNTVTLPGNGEITFADDFVRYVEGIDAAAFTPSKEFIPAFQEDKNASPLPKLTPIQQGVCVVPQAITGALKQNLVPGTPREYQLVYTNYTTQSVEVTPTALAPRIMRVEFPEASFKLAPGERRMLTAKLILGGPVEEAIALKLGGKANGEELVPLVVTINSALPIAVTGNSKFLEVKNSSNQRCDVEITLQAKYFKIEPAALKVEGLAPGETRRLPIAFTTKFNWKANMPLPYTVEVKWQGKSSSQFATAFPVMPLYRTSDSLDGMELVAANNGLKMNYGIYKEKEGVRIRARVFDSTPLLKGTRGGLKTDADVLIVAFNNEKGFREYGVSCTANEVRTYLWLGSKRNNGVIVGMEASDDAPAIVKSFKRTNDHYDLDLVIPTGKTKEGDQLSICVIDRDSKGGMRRIDLGDGILPHNPENLGVMLKH